MKKHIIFLFKCIAAFFFNSLFIISYVIPKKKNIWIFSSWNGRKYSDNPRAIFCRTLKNHPNIKAIWISKDKHLYYKLKLAGVPVAYAYNIDGFYYQMVAGAAIFSHSIDWDFLSFLISRQTKRVQTWHGIPIKRIGYDDTKYSKTEFRRRIINFLMPYKIDFNYDLVLAASNYDKSIYCKAFHVNNKKVAITGYPRNDQIFTQDFPKKKGAIKIIYMPTFRGEIGSEFQLLKNSKFDFEKTNKYMKELNALLYIKIHPVQIYSNTDLILSKKCSNIILMDPSVDVYENLSEFDMLITDFSGIFFDFLITGKPIIMAPIEFENYLKYDRKIYINYDDICFDSACHNWKMVFKNIEKNLRNKNNNSLRYKNLQMKFHKYLDSNSSERAYNEIIKLFACP